MPVRDDRVGVDGSRPRSASIVTTVTSWRSSSAQDARIARHPTSAPVDGLAVPAHGEPGEPAPGTRRSHDGAVAPRRSLRFPPVASGETNGRSIPSGDERTTRKYGPADEPRRQVTALELERTTRSRAGSRASTPVTVVRDGYGHGAMSPMGAGHRDRRAQGEDEHPRTVEQLVRRARRERQRVEQPGTALPDVDRVADVRLRPRRACVRRSSPWLGLVDALLLHVRAREPRRRCRFGPRGRPRGRHLGIAATKPGQGRQVPMARRAEARPRAHVVEERWAAREHLPSRSPWPAAPPLVVPGRRGLQPRRLIATAPARTSVPMLPYAAGTARRHGRPSVGVLLLRPRGLHARAVCLASSEVRRVRRLADALRLLARDPLEQDLEVADRVVDRGLDVAEPRSAPASSRG